jgi:hypothetical protein
MLITKNKSLSSREWPKQAYLFSLSIRINIETFIDHIFEQSFNELIIMPLICVEKIIGGMSNPIFIRYVGNVIICIKWCLNLSEFR